MRSCGQFPRVRTHAEMLRAILAFRDSGKLGEYVKIPQKPEAETKLCCGDEVSLLANQSREKPSLQLSNESVGWGGKDGHSHFHQQRAHTNFLFP